MPPTTRATAGNTANPLNIAAPSTALFDVRFEDAGFTSGELDGIEFSAAEARGYTDTAIAEALLPDGVAAVVTGYLAEDDGQGGEDRKVFASVTLRVRAPDEHEAARFRPPVRLLNAIADLMAADDTGTTQLALEGNWQVMDAELAETESGESEHGSAPDADGMAPRG